MTFQSQFQRPFTKPFPQQEGDDDTVDWWLSGGISAGDCVAAYQAKGAASLAASYVNLNDPGTYDLTLGLAPNWSSGNGWEFSGTTYLKTGITPDSSNWSVCLLSLSASYIGANRYLMGVLVSNKGLMIGGQATLKKYYNTQTGTVFSAPSFPSVFSIAGQKAYDNGLDEGITLGVAAVSWAEIYLGKYNAAGSPSVGIANNFGAVSFYNIVLSPSQVLAVTNEMSAL